MTRTLKTLLLLALSSSAGAFAAPPPDAPAGSMGICNDGSYSSSAEKKGACRGHKGVKDWYGSGENAAKMSTAATPAAKPVPAAMEGRSAESPSAMAKAPGGGAGQVWGNESSKVYHCSGDKWYGKTKHGAYMTEADAKAKGYHADHGKACG